MSTVYLTHEPLTIGRDGVTRPKFNMEPARAYGQVRPLMEWREPLDLAVTEIYDRLLARLESYDPANDYILPCGSPLVISLVPLAAADLGIEYVRFLLWSEGEYRVEKLPLLSMQSAA